MHSGCPHKTQNSYFDRIRTVLNVECTSLSNIAAMSGVDTWRPGAMLWPGAAAGQVGSLGPGRHWPAEAGQSSGCTAVMEAAGAKPRPRSAMRTLGAA